MRDHQKEGVKVSRSCPVAAVVIDAQFMYSCVMGFTEAEANGCILADEMGLGKTLQTIALIYTLLSKLIMHRTAQAYIQNNRPSRVKAECGCGTPVSTDNQDR